MSQGVSCLSSHLTVLEPAAIANLGTGLQSTRTFLVWPPDGSAISQPCAELVASRGCPLVRVGFVSKGLNTNRLTHTHSLVLREKLTQM